MPDTDLGYEIMRKFFVCAFVGLALVGVGSLCVHANSVGERIATSDIDHVAVHVTGNDDGPCHYCGPKKCPYFRAKSGANPITCKCGHSKRSHIDSY